MKIKTQSSRLLKPSYHTSHHPPTDVLVPLTPFDNVSFDTHVATLYAYRPPNPTNKVIEQGLRKSLAEYREWAGRPVYDDDGRRCILLNDRGMRFAEATGDYPLGYLDKPSPDYTLNCTSPSPAFACGSLVVGVTTHHMIADGFSTSHFLVAWGQATRDLPMDPLPLHDRSIFVPRNPPHYQFDHRGVEYIDRHESNLADDSQETMVVRKAHFSWEFLGKLKSGAAADCPYKKPFTTFECLLAHLWRKIARAGRLDGKQLTRIKIAVNGRASISNPPLPMRYFGNVVLRALPQSEAGDLPAKPVGHAARLIHGAVVRVDDDYFRSFFDFSSSEEKMKGLVPSADADDMMLCPDLEVDCWLRFPFYDLDFGAGCPDLFVPSYPPVEGLLIVAPSVSGNGDIDAFVPLSEKNMESFKEDFHSLE
ncbi:unnamed protein product [Victoria cruziana]